MKKTKFPEVIGYVACVLVGALVKRGYDQEVANDVAFEAADDVRREFGGQIVYFPKGKDFDCDERAAEIYGKFNGRNQGELAEEYGLSVPHIYRILARVRSARTRD